MGDDYNWRAYSYLSHNSRNTAIPDFDEAIRLNPNFTQAFYSRGKVKAALGHHEDAERDFKTALDLAEKKGDEKLMAQIKPMLS